MEDNSTRLEKIAASPVTEIATTLIAAIASTTTPVASLFPVLAKLPAVLRQKKRQEEVLRNISLSLEVLEEELQKISDQQYNIICEAIASTFNTINPKKLTYLQYAVKNSIRVNEIEIQESAVIARIIRDASAEEIKFFMDNHHYKYIHVTDNKNEEINQLCIPRASKDALVVSGLESIGVLEFGIGTMGDGDKLCFSSVTPKLLKLFEKSNA